MAILRQALGTNIKASHDFQARPSRGMHSLMNYFQSDGFDSAYPNIRPIVNDYMEVEVVAKDSNGKSVKSNILDAIYDPNSRDSYNRFQEKIAVSTLVLPNTYILVWRQEGTEAKPGAPFMAGGKNICGFTILENPAISYLNGKLHYQVGADTWTEDEVITLPGGVTPYNLNAGYSPSMAAKRWLTLDDYIADFQKGFFENGAIPAGTFIITAATEQEFDDSVNKLQDAHRGASKNNNVTYAPRPIDAQGKPAEHAQVEWIPFQQTNKDIDFKNLFKQTNMRIDMSYGVSAFIKGVDDAPNYATAQVSDKNFAKRAVRPLLVRNWGQFSHELNRITGGTGIYLSFNYEIPTVADEEEVKARANLNQSTMVVNLVNQGYTLGSIVDAFDLPKRLKLLSKTERKEEIDNDKPQVDEGDNVTPDPNDVDSVKPWNVKAELTEREEDDYEGKLYDVIQADMQAQINEAKSNAKALTKKEQEAVEAFTDAMMVVIADILQTSGEDEHDKVVKIILDAGLNADDAKPYELTQEEKDDYRDYLLNVGESYRADTQEAIQAVLDRANTEGWTKAELDKALQDIMSTDRYRIERLSKSEMNRSQQMGNLNAVDQITDDTGIKFNKVWNTSSATPCEFCSALNGKAIAQDESYLKVGQTLTGTDGGVLVNDFVDMDVTQAHPQCNCYITWEIVQ